MTKNLNAKIYNYLLYLLLFKSLSITIKQIKSYKYKLNVYAETAPSNGAICDEFREQH